MGARGPVDAGRRLCSDMAMPELPGAERILLPFAGWETDAATLSWGQHAVGRDIQAAVGSMCLPQLTRLQAVITADHVRAGFRRQIGRYPARRTRLE